MHSPEDLLEVSHPLLWRELVLDADIDVVDEICKFRATVTGKVAKIWDYSPKEIADLLSAEVRYTVLRELQMNHNEAMSCLKNQYKPVKEAK